MLIIAKKIHPVRLLAGAVILTVAGGFTAASLFLTQEADSIQTTAAAQADPRGIRSNADRIAYLQRWGWIPAEEPASVEDVLIPKTFDASYDGYLSLQRSQGFDLEAYAGKTVKRYTYAIHNYPGLQKDIWASLLIWKRQVIGGEIYSRQGDGFTHGLAYPSAAEDQGAGE